MVQFNINNGASGMPSPDGTLGLTDCGTCATHVSDCITGILGQAVLSALEITRNAFANKEAQLDPHNPEDVDYLYNIVSDVVASRPELKVAMPTDPAEIAKVKARIPEAIREGQAVYAAVGIIATRLQASPGAKPASLINPTNAGDLDAVFGKVVETFKGELPRLVSDAEEIKAYRSRMGSAVVTAIRAMPNPA